ncbi:MAG: DUF1295 domain-containing protein [Anaerolineales bacterium]
MTFLEVYLGGLVALMVVMVVLWVISLVLKDSSIVDPMWGMLFVVAAFTYFLLAEQGWQTRQWLILALVTIWGVRLSAYLAWRNLGKGEDYRYQEMRANNEGIWWLRSLFQVFILQGLIAWVVSISLLAAMWGTSPEAFTIFDVLGVVLWIIGFFFEAVGDWQMARFKANPENKGKVLDTGVWRYTRHPNYFGDSAQWWGFWLIALAAGGWWTVFSPIIMTFLLVRVSGVALLEKNLKKKDKYSDYIERTSAFIPMPPKKKSSTG